MANNSNIRDFRNAGAPEAGSDAEKSNRAFYAFVIAIPIIAVIAGLGYEPVMEFRGKNIAAVQQAELDVEARRRADNPLYALMNAPKNADGLIDSNTLFSSGRAPSPEVKARRDIMKRALNPQEFLSRVDAKAYSFSDLQMETLKYDRATWALSTCGHTDMRAFYIRQNKAQYEKLQAILDEAKAAKAVKTNAKQEKQAKKAEKHFDQMKNIETKSQALAFVASGGAGRHMDAIGGFGAMSSMMGDAASYKIRNRKQRFGKRDCSRVRTIVQSGTMKIKPNVRLK